jgi:hypothetical protein
VSSFALRAFVLELMVAIIILVIELIYFWRGKPIWRIE